MNSEKKKKILISGYYGHGNTGDEAILFSIAEQLKDHDLTVVSLNPEYTKMVQGLDSIDFFNTDEIEETIEKSDMIVMGGGGLFQEFPDIDYYETEVSHLFQNPRGKLMAFALVPIIAVIYNKPLFFLGQGIGPFYSERARVFYKFILSLPTLITVRDKYSYAWADKLGRNEMVHLSADPTFLLKPENEEKICNLLRENNLKEKGFITLSLRDWIYHALIQNAVGEIAYALNDFLKDNELKILFIPFQDIKKEGHPTQDKKIVLQLIDRLDKNIQERVFLVEEALKPQEILALMNKGLFAIGMRYHFLIFSILNNIPAISISYDEKCNQLMKEIGLEDLSVNIFEIDRHLLLSKINNVFNHIDEYKQKINDNLQEMKKRALNTFSLLHYTDSTDNKEISRDIEGYSGNEKIDDLSEIKKLVLYKDERIKDLKDELHDKGKIVEKIQAELSDKDRVIEGLQAALSDKEGIIEEKEITVNELNSRLSQAYTTLNLIYNSRTWKIGQIYGKLFGVEAKWRRSLSRLLGKEYPDIKSPDINEADIKRLEIEDTNQGIEQLRDFLRTHSGKKEIYFIFSPARFLNHGGQRGVRFAQELSLSNKPVVYIRCLQNHLKDEVNRIDENIIEYPLNWFHLVSQEIISSPLLRNKKKVIIFQVAFYSAFEIISYANAHGWITVYDIVDDWEGFYKEHFIVEYDKEIEDYLANNSDILVAVNQSLKDKFKEFGEVFLIPNGYSPRLLKDRPIRVLKKGSITLGFFGHLHPARFNWDLVINAAKRQKEWMFYIIGFGEPEGLALPGNIILTGPVEPSDLSGYAKNWDVAIIPYQNNELCKNLNPVKIFEYLYFGLPIVATGCEDIKNYPYSYYANDEDEFISFIKEAATIRVEKEKIGDLLQEATWENRLGQLLSAVEKRDDFKEFCIR